MRISALLVVFAIFSLHANEVVETITYEDLFEDQNDSSQKLKTAFRQGIFYFEIPSNCSPYIENMREFMLEKYENRNWKGFYELLPQGAQIEAFILSNDLWDTHLPFEVKELSTNMLAISTVILQKILASTQIPHGVWDVATGGAVNKQGYHFLSLLNYPPIAGREGCFEHQDYGYVNILHVNKNGLEAFIDESWYLIPPKSDCFMVFIGKNLEILVNDKNLVSSNLHRVREQEERRLSFGVFSDGLVTRPVFRFNYEENRLEKIFETTEEFHEGYDEEWIEN